MIFIDRECSLMEYFKYREDFRIKFIIYLRKINIIKDDKFNKMDELVFK